MCPWASNRRSLPDKIRPTVLVLVVKILLFFPSLPPNELCMQGKRQKKKKKTKKDRNYLLTSHLLAHAKTKYTPQQTHAFAQCEFTLITQAASAIGSKETV